VVVASLCIVLARLPMEKREPAAAFMFGLFWSFVLYTAICALVFFGVVRIVVIGMMGVEPPALTETVWIGEYANTLCRLPLHRSGSETDLRRGQRGWHRR